jgi:hypothetical protein
LTVNPSTDQSYDTSPEALIATGVSQKPLRAQFRRTFLGLIDIGKRAAAT